MMRPVAADGARRFTCAEHGGDFAPADAYKHLAEHHPELTQAGGRILEANRDVLPVNPSRQFEPTNRAARRANKQRKPKHDNHAKPIGDTLPHL